MKDTINYTEIEALILVILIFLSFCYMTIIYAPDETESLFIPFYQADKRINFDRETGIYYFLDDNGNPTCPVYEKDGSLKMVDGGDFSE